MLFFTYKTTNLLNGKYYLGRHEAQTLDDGYLGSGFALKAAIKKYGVENFLREILTFYDSKEDLVEAEKTLITEDIVNDKLSYNMREGGWGGSSVHEWTEERKRNHSAITKKRMENSDARKVLSESLKKARKEGRCDHVPLPPNVKGIKRSEETKQKISKAHLGMKKEWVTNEFKKGTSHSEKTKQMMSESHKGERNSMSVLENRKKVGESKIGRKKMFDLEDKGYYVKKEEIEEKLSLGWRFK